MLNRAILIGRLTKDPELRYTTNGTAVATFSLAVQRSFNKDETDFLNIVTWRQQAEHCANYLKKGRLVAIEGRIQTRSYDGQDGKKVYVTEIVADNVRFLESTKKDEPTTNDPFANDGQTIDISDEDLPF